MSFAPIILFVYNRPNHTSKTLEALRLAEGANSSVLHVFADGPKSNASDEELDAIYKVREIIKRAKGFKDITLHIKQTNEGLASSVISAVDELLTSNEVVITIEDDVIAGKYLLSYLNQALELYHDKKNVLMVSGYGFNLPFNKSRKKAFFLPTGSTQAWGTWKHSWDQIDFKASGYESLKSNKKLSRKFDVNGGMNYSEMLISQMEMDNEQYSSWAIRFRWSLFKLNGLTLFPPHNLIENTGWDGSGKHSGTTNPYKDKIDEINEPVEFFPSEVDVKKSDFFRLVMFFYRMKVVGYLKNIFK